MPEQIARGAVITLEAFTTDSTGAAIDATSLTISIANPTGTTVLANQTPTHVGTGIYQYAYSVAADAPLGAWAADWAGVVGGVPLGVEDGFTVVPAFQIGIPVAGVPTTDTLITETENHLLGGDRDEQNRLTNSVTATDTQVQFEFPLGGIQQGAYVCIDLEVMYVWSVNSSSNTATVQRGQLGSAPTVHNAGTLCYINPLFSKWAIFKQLNTEIVDLSSADNGLYRERSFELTTQPVNKNYTVPAANDDLVDVLEIRWQEVGPEKFFPRVRRNEFQVLRDLNNRDPGNSGLSLRIERGFVPGRPLIVRYAADFGQLSTIADDAAAVTGMSATMLDIPPLGAAARLMGVREAKRAFVERAVNSRRAAEVPGGEAARAAGVLLQLLQERVRAEAARLRRLWPAA